MKLPETSDQPTRRRSRWSRWQRCVLLVFAVAVTIAGLSDARPARAGGEGSVYVVEVTGTIDLGLAPFLERVLEEAEDAGAAAMIVEIDTPGGRLDAVLQMREALLDSPVRTLALVDGTALSAGALVALASEEIHMTPGAVIGAATPVVGGSGETADEKVVSAVRTVFASTAELRGRDPRVAEAMVDPDVAVEGVVEAGDLLTLTAAEAQGVGYADGLVADRGALLDAVGLADREVVERSPSLAERTVRFVTNPVVASLLITLGMWLVLGDLLTGGVGVAAAAGVALLAIFFGGHMLAGLAGWEDVALVAVGVALIALELLVVPGFGVPGILGLAALLGGAFLAMLNRDFDFVTQDQLVRAALSVGASFVLLVAGSVAMLALLSRTGRRDGLVLRAQVGIGAPVTERGGSGWLRWLGGTARLEPDRPEPGERRAPEGPLVGAVGTALSDLRPSGVADIGGQRRDVVTTGEYVARGDSVEVVREEGYRTVVRRRE